MCKNINPLPACGDRLWHRQASLRTSARGAFFGTVNLRYHDCIGVINIIIKDESINGYA